MSDQQPPLPKKSWWARLNEKPPGWDNPANRAARWISAIAIGLILFWLRSRQ
jgi:hypothetical protein